MKKSKILMLIGVSLILTLFVFPMWTITLVAPQYPTPIGMNIHINSIKDLNPNDVTNINIMNHYVGMKSIPEQLEEFKVFPIVVVFMFLLGVIIALKMNYKWYLVWFFLISILGILGLYDFYLWEYDYGHNLSEKAAIKFTDASGNPLAYQPPLWGSKTILNFVVDSYPTTGAYLMFAGIMLTIVAFFVGKKESKSNESKINKNTLLVVPLFLIMGLSSCTTKPQPIDYGKDSCTFCSMTIVDKQHASEIVTKKGKVYKYDAIECMMNDKEHNDENSVASFLITNYLVPAELINAKEAIFLKSETIPSPMGANLSGYVSKEEAQKMQAEKSGEIFNWTELKQQSLK